MRTTLASRVLLLLARLLLPITLLPATCTEVADIEELTLLRLARQRRLVLVSHSRDATQLEAFIGRSRTLQAHLSLVFGLTFLFGLILPQKLMLEILFFFGHSLLKLEPFHGTLQEWVTANKTARYKK
jgi:hypothetical protein